jgi:hypothetical protein
MTRPRDWTRRALEIAAGPPRPEEVDHLQAALPSILARARRARESAAPATIWDLLVPLTRRWLPALLVAAASLALLVFLWPVSSEPWESSLLAQAGEEAAAGDIVADAIAGVDAP